MEKQKQSINELLRQCSVRVSARAKYLRLVVSIDKGVELVVPQTMSASQLAMIVPGFISDKQEWINSTLGKLQRQALASKPLTPPCQLPDSIYLKAINHKFTVSYVHRRSSNISLRATDSSHLNISGELADKQRVFQLLENYLKKFAYKPLYQRLSKLSHQTGLKFNKMTVRAQKTRWGSCSGKKNISLNYRLLFIESDLVDYILMHELAHTKYLNHSKQYWHLLEKIMPDFKQRDTRVNQIAAEIPCWVMYKYHL